MKCISLWQPWASLMSIGAKKIETRSWTTSYRGWLAIHASKKWDSEQKLTARIGEFRTALDDKFPTIQERCFDFGAYRDGTNFVLPIGRIVAIAKLVDCARMEECGDCDGCGWYEGGKAIKTRCSKCGGCGIVPGFHCLAEQEAKFGDYSSGRFGWVTEALFRLPEPIPFKARQGLFDLPSDVVEEIRKQWRDHA